MAANIDARSSDESIVGNGLGPGRPEWVKVALASVADAVAAADARGAVTFLNAAAEGMTGWTHAEAAGRAIDAVVRIVDEETRAEVENPATLALRTGRAVEASDLRLVFARDGAARPVEPFAAPVLDDAGGLVGVVLVVRDRAEHRRRELSEQEALCYAEEIVATLREPFLVLDAGLRVLTANAAFYRDFHVDERETIGRFIDDLGDGQWNIPALRVLLERAVPNAPAVDDFEVERVFPEIGLRSMRLNARRFPPDGEHPNLVLLSIQDVTDREASDAALKDSELRFRRLFQTARDGILILETDSGSIIEANPFMCGLLGFELDDFLGKELWEIGLFEDREANLEAYQDLLTKGYIRYENLPLRTKGGEEVEVEFVSNLYTIGDRRIAQCNIRDVTHRSRLERQAKAQVVALADMHRRKDEFLAMLSHELRNPLSPILNAVHLLRLQGAGT